MKIKDAMPFRVGRWPFFYGYVIILCSVALMMMSAPGQTIGVSVFTDFLIENLGLSRIKLSFAYFLGTMLSAFFMTRTGRLMDRAGIRVILLPSAVGLGLALLLMANIDRAARGISGVFGGILPGIDPFHAAGFGAVTVGFFLIRYFGQGVFMLASRTLLMRWFDALRGRVNSIAGVGISIVLSGSPLFFNFLIEGFGWRHAWVILGAIVGLGFTLFAFLFVRDTPEGSGLVPDGRKTERQAETGDREAEISWTLKEARKTYCFWSFGAVLFVFGLLATANTFHIVSIFETAGRTRSEAISIFLPGTVIGVMVNLTTGWLADKPFFRNRLHWFLVLNCIGLILGAIGIIFLSGNWGKSVLILGNGIANGLFGLNSTVMWARYFGKKHLGEINGAVMTLMIFASAIGPLVFSLSFSWTGRYFLAQVVGIGILVFLIVGAFKADRPSRIALKR